MADIPSTEPSEIVAGDTLKFKKSLSDYPATIWTLTYYLLKSGTQITFSGTADGTDHLINVANTTTAGWTAGICKFESYISKTGERYEISSGTIEVKPNLATQTSGYDTRSHAKKVLDALESLLEGKASRDVMQITINGQSISKLTPDELRKWRNEYRSQYQAEIEKENIKNGKPSKRRILTRL